MKILIIYTSVGLGHKVVAENIGTELKDRKVEVIMLDILELYRGGMISGSEKIYKILVRKLPWLWRFFYNNPIFLWSTLPLRSLVARLKAGKLARYVKKQNPDLILTTQTTATAIVSHLKQKGIYHGKFAAAFSDFHFHPYWVYPGIDLFLLNIPEQTPGLKKHGCGEKDSLVVGLPVDKAFGGDFVRSEILQSYELTHAGPIVLVMGGSRGWGLSEKLIDEISKSDYELQIVIICGANREFYNRIQKAGSKYKDLRVLGNISNKEVARLYSVAYALITKPGGLTAAQAIASELPMILTNPFPGMEEKNQDYLESQGVGVSARNPHEVRSWLERILADTEFYRKMKENMRRIRKPRAARDAAQALIDLLEQSY